MFAKVSEVRMCVWRKSNLDAARAPGSAGGKELVKNFDISCCHQQLKCTTLKERKLEIPFCFIVIPHYSLSIQHVAAALC